MNFKTTILGCGALLLAGVTQSALAVVDYNSYVGAGLGVSRAKINDPAAAFNVDDEGFAWRIMGGYNFTENLSVEFGYTHFKNVGFVKKPNTNPYGKLELQALDLVLKGIIPMDYGFGLYGEAGIAYVDNKVISVGGNPSFAPLSERRYTLTYGLGGSYDLDGCVIDLGWRRFQHRDFVPTVDFAYIGTRLYVG
jgi:opacity protein-like surface antigen